MTDLSQWCWCLYDNDCHKVVKIVFQKLSVPEHAQTTLVFLAPLKKTWGILFLPLTPISELADRCRLIFFHIHLHNLWAWHDLCSPSHLIITLFLPLFLHSLFFTPSYRLLLLFGVPIHSLLFALSFLNSIHPSPPLLILVLPSSPSAELSV